jgi:hypothetical protein
MSTPAQDNGAAGSVVGSVRFEMLKSLCTPAAWVGLGPLFSRVAEGVRLGFLVEIGLAL